MSYSETITRTDLTNILNEVLPSTHGIGISKGSWTSSGTSAYNIKVTSDLTLSKGLYLVTIHTPYVASGIGYVGLRVNDVADNSCVVVAPTNEYARGAFLIDLSAQSTVAGYSEGSQAVTYSVLERGGIEAIQLVRYTESPEVDYIVEQGSGWSGYYRKWSSGNAEYWYNEGSSSGLNTTVWREPIWYGDYSRSNLWSGLFNSTPRVYASSNHQWVIGVLPYSITKDGCYLRYLTIGQASGQAYGASLYARGTWK